MGMAGSAAGSPFAQGQTSDVNRAQQETADQARQTQSVDKAEAASGVGETEQDEGTSDRDADGRRLWEAPPEPQDEEQTPTAEDAPRGKDPTGETGARLDLSG
jgi:hypothetical protein